MNDTTNDGGSAFPFGQISELTGQPINGCFSPGMSLRDWFAGMALQGELASTADVESTQAMAEAAVSKGREPVVHLAMTCYEIADAMIKVREVKS